MPHKTLPHSEDYHLLQQVSAGDEDAFKELYFRYHVLIYNYILRLIHEPSAAEDILQNVFWAVWQGSGKFRATASVKTWIFRIAHHQTISWLRSHKKKNQASENFDELLMPSDAPLPEDLILKKIESTRIRNALEQLSPNHRSVIELTFIYGFAYKEIAKIMDCPIGTVKSRMSYALRYLSAEIIKQDPSN